MVLHIDFPCFYIYLPSSDTPSSYLNLLNVNYYIIFCHLFYLVFFFYYFFIFYFLWTLAALCCHLGISGPHFEKPLFQATHRLCVISDIPAFVYVSSFKPERKQASIHTQISAYITLCVFVYVSVCPAL